MYLHRLRVDGVRGLHGPRAADLTLAGTTSGPGLFVIAGRNESGKTTLLRAAAAVLAGPDVVGSLTDGGRDWVSHGHTVATVTADLMPTTASGAGTQHSATVRWEQTEGPGSRPQVRGSGTAGPSLWSAGPAGRFAAGYGPYRRLAAADGHVARLMAGHWTVARFVTLFREDASLAEAVPWLQQADYRARSGQAGYAELVDRVVALLNDGLLPGGHTVDRVDPDGLWVRRTTGPPVRVEELSDGHRTVAALVVDIVRQAAAGTGGRVAWAGDGRPVVMAPGVVLIDAVEVHLHQSWQERIGPWLLEHFPRVQFIVTSHSPHVRRTASPGGQIELPDPAGQARSLGG